MGQRHQLFVIATVNGRYRTLAVIHYQWLYGRQAVSQCLQAIGIFSAPANQAGLRRELARAEKVFKERSGQGAEALEPAQFPFIATCLAIGASYNERDDCDTRVSPEHIYLEYDALNNNDDITVFDMTSTDKVRYAMMMGYEPVEEDHNQHSAPLETILNARAYLSTYYTDAELIAMNETDLSATLQSAWPEGTFHTMDGYSEAVPPQADRKATAISLKEKMLSKVIDTALECDPSDLSWVAEAQQLPDFANAVNAKLTAKPDLLNSPSGKALLCRALHGGDVIDLSPFRALTSADVIDIVQSLTEQDKPKSFKLILPDLDLDSLGLVEDLDLGTTELIDLKSILDAVKCPPSNSSAMRNSTLVHSMHRSWCTMRSWA